MHFQLERINRKLAIMDQYLTRNDNFSKMEFLILLYIYANEGITQYKISKYLNIDMPRINQIVKKLEKEEIIAKEIDSTSKIIRKKLILTDQGRNTINEILKEKQEVYHKCNDIFSNEEANDMLKHFEHLAWFLDSVIKDIEI